MAIMGGVDRKTTLSTQETTGIDPADEAGTSASRKHPHGDSNPGPLAENQVS